MLAHVPSCGRNPRGSPDSLAYPVPKACQRRVLGTGVPRCLGVARSASSPKAALALGCSLTPGLRVLFGGVTCMARAASVSGLWTLGFLLLCGVRAWVWGSSSSGFSWLGVWVWRKLGFGCSLPSCVPGRSSRFVPVGAGCACISPVLVRLCGACVWVRVVGLDVGMTVGVSLPFRLSWPGLAVRGRVRVGTSSPPTWPSSRVVCVGRGLLCTLSFLTWLCGVWPGSGSL